MEKSTEHAFDLYQDIRSRCGGEIYIGVVGPVRTGKSTFIRRFMEQMVIPNMTNPNERSRAVDELPQGAQGRMIMTTEPKFVPKDQVEVELGEKTKAKIRLVDCVGFLIPGAGGHMENGQQRMVKTPWSEEESPFEEAARIGTEKVIRDHATVGIIVTCDGTFGEIDRDAYVAAEAETVKQLQQLGKPFVMLLNSLRPYNQETKKLAERLEETYHCAVIPVNCEQMKKEDIHSILEKLLYEFPVTRINFDIPKWTEMLPPDHEIKQNLMAYARGILEAVTKVNDVYQVDFSDSGTYIAKAYLEDVDLHNGMVYVHMTMEEKYYYENLSRMTGLPIDGEYQLISVISRLAQLRKSYEKVQEAMQSVQAKGYGVVLPELSDISMEEPVLIRHGNKFGVKIKALSPSIHMIRANIETEIAPIVGSEEQANDLIAYIREEQKESGVFETNIFGKSIGELVEDGIRSKIASMDDECQLKLQDTMQKIVNDNNGGLICFII